MAEKPNETISEQISTAKKRPARKITDDTIVNVLNNCKGILYYKSTSNVVKEWGAQGDEQEFTIKELKEMKAQQSVFFKENWVIFPEDQLDVIAHLKIDNHYKNAILPDDIDAMLQKSVDELSVILDTVTSGVKALILGKAREKYESKELTDTHIINLIQDKLNADIDIENPRR
jgi:hypothetical protein